MEVLPRIKAWPLVAASPPSPYCFGELLLDTFPTKGLPLSLLAGAASPKRPLPELIYWRLTFLLPYCYFAKEGCHYWSLLVQGEEATYYHAAASPREELLINFALETCC